MASIGLPDGSVDDAGSLRGDFALAALRGEALVLVRGRIAGRPLYYARERGGAVIACSRLAPLLAALDDVHALNPDCLGAMALLGPSREREETAYTGVKRLCAGQILRFMADRIPDVARLPLPSLPPLSGSPEELGEMLKSAVEATVHRALRDAGRVAVMAGGGVDSSALLATTVAIARGAGRPEVEAIALDFAGPGDDRPHLRSLADALGIVPIRVKPAACGKHLRGMMTLDAAPMAWLTGGWMIEMGRLARERGADTILSGDGGDDLLDGDPTALAARALDGQPLRAVVAAARLRVPWPMTPVARVLDFVVRPAASSLIPSPLLRLWRGRRSVPRVPWAGPHLTPPRIPPRTLPRTPEDIFTQLAHAPHLLELGDMRGRIESATGCMQKNPYVDDRLLELVARIPPDVMLHQNRLRGLFRFAFRRVLPESLRLRTDKARFEPAVREMLGAVGGLESFRDLASMETLGAMGIVEPARYRAGFDVLARSSGTYESEGRDWARFWPPLAVEAFARAHRDVAGAARGRP